MPRDYAFARVSRRAHPHGHRSLGRDFSFPPDLRGRLPRRFRPLPRSYAPSSTRTPANVRSFITKRRVPRRRRRASSSMSCLSTSMTCRRRAGRTALRIWTSILPAAAPVSTSHALRSRLGPTIRARVSAPANSPTPAARSGKPNGLWRRAPGTTRLEIPRGSSGRQGASVQAGLSRIGWPAYAGWFKTASGGGPHGCRRGRDGRCGVPSGRREVGLGIAAGPAALGLCPARPRFARRVEQSPQGGPNGHRLPVPPCVRLKKTLGSVDVRDSSA